MEEEEDPSGVGGDQVCLVGQRRTGHPINLSVAWVFLHIYVNILELMDGCGGC